ncbi:hypothetical protein JCGZ_21101 [Jatropha curcas]|uniref:Uncharacterized protein n=1 Tax=Jatropha curcas TaxID=180498 RepID=A0A067JTA9_JATCU|nr:hypothetical protein JCGZ_21101 [Jatropha curcas]
MPRRRLTGRSPERRRRRLAPYRRSWWFQFLPPKPSFLGWKLFTQDGGINWSSPSSFTLPESPGIAGDRRSRTVDGDSLVRATRGSASGEGGQKMDQRLQGRRSPPRSRRAVVGNEKERE